MPVPFTFSTANASIALSQFDSNFATAITVGNTAVQLGNTITTINNITLPNVTISSGTVTVNAGSNTAPSINFVGNTTSGFSLPAANIVAISTGGSERVRIDNAGNVGIATAAPSQKLDVGGVIKATASSKTIYLNPAFGGSADPAVQSNEANLVFCTNNNEQGRFDTDGNFLIKTTGQIDGAYGSRLNVDAGANNGIIVKSTASTWNSLVMKTGATLVGYITATTTSASYNSASDYRLKENVKPMTGALRDILFLRPVVWDWKADGSYGEGFIAHELQLVKPIAVTGKKDEVDKDGNPVYQGIDPSKLVATLVGAIQELSEQVKTLQSEVSALKGGL